MSRSPFRYIPGLKQNTALQLIMACGVATVALGLIKGTMLVAGYKEPEFYNNIIPWIGLPAAHAFFHKFWTILTYGWFCLGFWELVTNMMWLYCFGSLVNSLIGYRQVIPIFIYSMMAGALAYTFSQYIPGPLFGGRTFLLGPQAAIIGLTTASLTISPYYRLFLTERFSVSLWIVAVFFILLTLATTGNNIKELPVMLMMVASGGMGYFYVLLLKKGFKPGDWMYRFTAWVQASFTPNERRLWQSNNHKRNEVLNKMKDKKYTEQKRVDDILDKINRKGYNALSDEEKDFLIRVSKEK